MPSVPASRLRPPMARLLLAIALLLGLVAGSLPGIARAAEPVRIMPLGDSITHGLASSHYCCGVPGAYRIRLDALLRTAGYGFDFVGSQENGPQIDKDHEGHPGYRIDEVHTGGDGGADTGVNGGLAARPPDVVLLMVGTNDILQNHNLSGAPGRMGALLDRIIAMRPTADIYVASIPPLVGPESSLNPKVVTYNTALRDLVAAKAAAGQRVHFVNAYAALTASDIGSDGVHPNIAGHNKIADAWAAALLGSTPPPPPPTDPTPPVSRLAGADRYATAAAVSAAGFPAAGVPFAFIATGANFPDALAAGPAAATRGGPVLLVTSNAIPQATATELARLRPARIVVLGGAGVVRDGVLNALREYSGTVTRVAGADRYATAAAISATYFGSPATVAYIATGENFPDALAGGAAAGRDGGPILLARRSSIPATTANELTRLRPARIVVLGGSGVVDDAVLNALRGYSGNVSRISGSDRYATAAATSATGYAAGSRPIVYLATGSVFPDGLAAAPVAARREAPLLLTAPNQLPPATATELKRLNAREVIVLGSTGAVSDTVIAQIRALWP